jgi:dTDP-4-amino-4,6-dideoxygalactose transaminase
MFSETNRIGPWIYDMEILGFNYRITDFQAALGISQLKKIDLIKARRRKIVNYYNEHFADIDELILPYEADYVKSNFHLYILQIKENSSFDRYDLFTYLRSMDYLPMVHYIPLHLLSYYKDRYGYKRGDFPIAEKFYDRAITIPLYPSLSDNEVEKVVKDIISFVKS